MISVREVQAEARRRLEVEFGRALTEDELRAIDVALEAAALDKCIAEIERLRA